MTDYQQHRVVPTWFESARGGGQRLQGPAHCGLHVAVENPRRGAHPGRLLPASLPRLLHLGGAGGGAYRAVVHLDTKQRHVSRVGSGAGVEKKILDRFLTLLTASVAMPSMAAPPTPKTSLAFESMKSMAVPMPLSSFFPLRSPFTPAILPLTHINVNIEGKEMV